LKVVYALVYGRSSFIVYYYYNNVMPKNG
jgi:hypothetical protein